MQFIKSYIDIFLIQWRNVITISAFSSLKRTNWMQPTYSVVLNAGGVAEMPWTSNRYIYPFLFTVSTLSVLQIPLVFLSCWRPLL